MANKWLMLMTADERLQGSPRALAWVIANYDWAVSNAEDKAEALEALIEEALTIERMTKEDTN